MRTRGPRTLPSHRLAAAVRLLLLLFMSVCTASACEWDYPIWIPRDSAADPLYRFVQKDKAGYIDRAGRVVIKPVLETDGNFGEEFIGRLLHLGVSDARYVDTTGKLVINRDYSSAWDFSEGLAAALPVTHGKWGYIDRSGDFAISPRFADYPHGYVYSFSDGLAMIEVEKKYGYIDHTGEFRIPPTFLYGADFHEGLARVVVEGPCAYSSDGPCPDSRLLGDPTQATVPPCKFTFVDKSGAQITAERFDYARDFSEGLAPVRVGDKWGFVDSSGRIIIHPQFDDAWPFSDGLARVRQGTLFGYIDRAGVYAVSPRFKYAEDFSEGLAVVVHWDEKDSDYDEFYYVDKQGVQAAQERFALASRFFKGLAHVKLKTGRVQTDDDEEAVGTFAYIDRSGKRVFTYSGER